MKLQLIGRSHLNRPLIRQDARGGGGGKGGGSMIETIDQDTEN